MIKYILKVLFTLISLNIFGQTKDVKWTFFKESDGISVFYKITENTAIKELKLTTTVKSNVKTVSSFITNVDSLVNWGYGCMQSDLLKWVNSGELYYYYAVDVPWPLSDRDVVINMKITEDPNTGITTIRSRNSDGYLPEKEDRTRVKFVRAQWTFTPIEANLIQLDFVIAANLGANFPDWLVNYAMSYSPIKSILALKEKVEE